METIFIDPMIHSRRIERVRMAGMALIPLLVVAALWVRWMTADKDPSIRFPMMITSMLVPALGLGYYMLKRYRQVLMERTWFSMSDEGISRMTPAGPVSATWSEVEEVKIGLRPSATRMPDVLIKTPGGYISAYMRWVDRSGPVPEPSLLAPGRRFYYPGGEVKDLESGNSELVAAISRHVPPEKIKQGVMISL